MNMDRNEAHKFKHGGGSSSFNHIVFCEYCGHIAHAPEKIQALDDASDIGMGDAMQAMAKEPCPRALMNDELDGGL